MEILKLIAAVFFGGAGGALLNEYFRRRAGRIQTITLIERVNRELRPELKGITLARVMTVGEHRQLDEIRNLREYQLTLRNTSKVHLQDVEIQFEFPTEDVQAWASRPVRSQTPLLPVNSTASEPYQKSFRWIIPHLPVGDLVEFTFQAVAPPSADYAAALYKADRVVIEHVSGEPKAAGRDWRDFLPGVLLGFLLTFVITIMPAVGTYLLPRILNTSSEITTLQNQLTGSGCDLNVKSEIYTDLSWKDKIWQIRFYVLNIGHKPCEVDWRDAGLRKQIDAGETASNVRVVTVHPLIRKSQILFNYGAASPASVEIDTFLPKPNDSRP